MQGKKYGSHSDTHPHVNNLSYEKNIEEIEKSNDKIEKVTGSNLPSVYPFLPDPNNLIPIRIKAFL